MTVRVETPRWFRIAWRVDLALVGVLTLLCVVTAVLGRDVFESELGGVVV